MSDTTFQFIGYRIVKRADFRKRHLPSHVSLLFASLAVLLLPEEPHNRSDGVAKGQAGYRGGGGLAMKPRCLPLPYYTPPPVCLDNETGTRDIPRESVIIIR